MFKKWSKLTATVLAVLMLFLLTACGTSTVDSGKKGAGDYKMVLILPGPINDQSWNATNYAGLVSPIKPWAQKWNTSKTYRLLIMSLPLEIMQSVVII